MSSAGLRDWSPAFANSREVRKPEKFLIALNCEEMECCTLARSRHAQSIRSNSTKSQPDIFAAVARWVAIPGGVFFSCSSCFGSDVLRNQATRRFCAGDRTKSKWIHRCLITRSTGQVGPDRTSSVTPLIRTCVERDVLPSSE
jgi:hypothetical protein